MKAYFLGEAGWGDKNEYNIYFFAVKTIKYELGPNYRSE